MVCVLVSIHIIYVLALGFGHVERVRREKTYVVLHPARKKIPRLLVKLTGTRSLLLIILENRFGQPAIHPYPPIGS
jgi:hypothetical protein